MAVEALSTTKLAERAKKFAAAALGDDDKSLCGSVSKTKNVPITILAEYSDYTNILPSDSATVLPEYTGINDHLIDLVDNNQLPYDLPSRLVARRCSNIAHPQEGSFQLCV